MSALQAIEFSKEEYHKWSIRDEAKGTFQEVNSKVKGVAGRLSNKPELEAEGTGEKIVGKIEEKIGQIKQVPVD